MKKTYEFFKTNFFINQLKLYYHLKNNIRFINRFINRLKLHDHLKNNIRFNHSPLTTGQINQEL